MKDEDGESCGNRRSGNRNDQGGRTSGSAMDIQTSQECVEREEIPDDWKKGIIMPVFKKGDRRVCSNYRGITIISHVVKVMERILEKRIRAKVESQIEEEQFGFRGGRSTVEPIFILRQNMEKSWEYGKDMVMTFIDLEKAYDSIPRTKVWESLTNKGIDKELRNMITAMYMDCYSSVKTRVGTSEWFKIDTGLKQGSVLSPLLFLMVMDDIMKAAMKDYSRAKMTVLLFADDVIWGKDQMEVQEQLDILNEKIEQWGLKINEEKSKTVVLSRGEKEGKGVIKVGDKELEVVKYFKYLGSELTVDGRLDLEISRRIQLGSAFYDQQVRGLV